MVIRRRVGVNRIGPAFAALKPSPKIRVGPWWSYTRSMEFGIGYFPTHDATAAPGTVARIVEESAATSRSSSPSTRTSRPAARLAYPAGGSYRAKYIHTYDLFVALTAAAAATSRLRVGSGICLVIERDPITTAKEVASVDRLSGGRFEFGVGAGWNREELSNHGTDPRTRMRLMRERVEAMKAIWTEEEASYHGEFVTSSGSGPGPSPPSARTRRCSSAATGRLSSTGCSPSATPGFPTTAREGILERAASSAPGPNGQSTSWRLASRPRLRCLSELRRGGLPPRVRWVPSGPTGRDRTGARALGVDDRRAQRRGVTPAEARDRFAAGRVARLATADAARPAASCPSGLRRRRRRRSTAQSTTKPKRSTSAAAPQQRPREPLGRPARGPLRRRRLGRSLVGAGRRPRPRSGRRRVRGCACRRAALRALPATARRWRGAGRGRRALERLGGAICELIGHQHSLVPHRHGNRLLSTKTRFRS